MPDSRLAIIVGAGGQDGTLLKQSLQSKGLEAISVYRDSYQDPTGSVSEFSVRDASGVDDLVSRYQPDRIYYLAAHHTSSQGAQSDSDVEDYDKFHGTHVVGLHNFLESIRKSSPQSRLFFASSSLVFDGSIGRTQNENTPFIPVGFYGLTKLQGMMLCRHYRKEHGVFAASGILFSHESSHRRSTYLSKKLITTICEVAKGKASVVTVGDLDSVNDWGYAADYVEAFQLILGLPDPSDYVVATGEGHTVREFAQVACNFVGVKLSDCVVEDKSLLLRRAGTRIGDFSKLSGATGWKPRRSFKEMVERLVEDHLQSGEGC